MADIPYIQQAQEVKITGQDSTGDTVNYVTADANGNLAVKDYSDGPVTPGTVASVSSLMGGQFNTVLPTLTNAQQAALQLDSSGRVISASTPLDGHKATYSASISDLVSVASATDLFTITGSATKTVKILEIRITATQPTAAFQDILLIKRSTDNTGGTSTSPTRVPHDSTNPAATATINAYTANPALGVAVGTIRSSKLMINAAVPSNAATSTAQIPLLFDFGNRPGQALTLRGTSEVLAVNLNGQTIVTSSFDIYVEWTEE